MAIAYVCDRCSAWSIETSQLIDIEIPGNGVMDKKKLAICGGCLKDLHRWAGPIVKDEATPRLQEAKKL